MVITNVNQVVYQGDGVTTAFPFTFRIIDATDIKLLLLDSDGTETDINSDYYVDTVNNTVHYPGYAPGAEPALSDRPPVLAEGQRLVIYREMPITQEKDLGDKWPFYVIELALDKLTMILQQVFDWWGRTLKVSQGKDITSDVDLTVPMEPGTVIKVNSDGNGFEGREAMMETNGYWDGEGRKIASIGEPSALQDATTKNYVDTLVATIVAEGGNIAFFNNVAALRVSDIAPGITAGTKGYYDVNDGGNGLYSIREKDVSDVDDGGSIIFLNNGNVAELITDGTVNVKQFGAKGDGVTDDYDALQHTLNFVPNGGCVYFPKGRYKISTGLILKKNDVTIYSDFRAEYLCTIYSSDSIAILTVTGSGARIQGINFWGNGNGTTFGSTNGIVFDRRSLGLIEGNANIDAEVRDCGFVYIDTCITGYGRNVFAFDCIFSNSKVGVDAHSFIHEYGYSQLRGWRITGNRFHSMGNPIKHMTTIPEELESWCIKFPLDDARMYHIEIANNNSDFCYSGFYYGALIGVMMHDNYIVSIAAPFIYSLVTENRVIETMPSKVQCIANNVVSMDVEFANNCNYAQNLIVFEKSASLLFKGNVFKNIPKEAYKIGYSYNINIEGDSIISSNYQYLNDNIKRSVISVVSSGNLVIKNTFIRSQVSAGNVYSYALSAPSAYEVVFDKNIVKNADKSVQIASCDKLYNNDVGAGIDWEIPTFMNNYSYASGLGWRRRFDGFVEINVEFTAGDDNSVVFTLPAGCRPKSDIYLTGTTFFYDKPANVHYILIKTDGNVVLNYAYASATPAGNIILNTIFEVGN